MVETTRLGAGGAESTNSFRGKPQKPDLVTSFFLLSCSRQPFMSNCSQEIKIILWCQRSCSTVADIREARTIWQSALCSYKHVSVLCLEMFCCLLEIQKIDRRKKLCTNIKKRSYRKKQLVYGPMAFGGCLPRGAQSSYLTRDHHPVGTEPASGRGIVTVS